MPTTPNLYASIVENVDFKFVSNRSICSALFCFSFYIHIRPHLMIKLVKSRFAHLNASGYNKGPTAVCRASIINTAHTILPYLKVAPL